MPYTLVVVDMQDAFDASLSHTAIIHVAFEIEAAKKGGHNIIFLEYTNCGPTHDALLNLVRGYKHVARIIKASDDGSEQVVRTCRRRGFGEKRFRVCGVNTDCCVYATVDNLLRKLPKSKIKVVKRACNTNSVKHDWRRYIRHNNLELV